MQPINVYIGYDQRESIAYHVAVQSLMDNTKHPNVKVTPLNTKILRDAGIYTRGVDPKQSNDFSFTRFLVPYLSGYSGRSIFCDCDVLFMGDIEELWEKTSLFRSDNVCSVYVCKHDYVPKDQTKYLGNTQHKYAKKNWSSVMVFNNGHYDVQRLTPEYVNTASGLQLHQFKWCKEDRIGSIGLEWNWLVGEYEYNPQARLAHFTVGGPWFEEYTNCDYSEKWRESYERAIHVLGRGA